MSLSSFSSLGSTLSSISSTNFNACIVGSGYDIKRSFTSNQNLPAMGTIYTIEFYMRNSTNGGSQESIISIGDSNVTSAIQCNFGVLTNSVQIYNTNTGGINVFPTPAYTVNTWRHIAYVKNGTNMTIYVNGVQQANQTINNNSLGANRVKIFQDFIAENLNANINTFVNNIRITNKVVYTGNFTPPVQSNNLPLTQQAGTNISSIATGDVKLLLTFENNQIFDKSGNITSWLSVNGGPVFSSIP
jgi:hypothetical protein